MKDGQGNAGDDDIYDFSSVKPPSVKPTEKELAEIEPFKPENMTQEEFEESLSQAGEGKNVSPSTPRSGWTPETDPAVQKAGEEIAAEKEAAKVATPEPAADTDPIKAASTSFVNDMVGAAMDNAVKRDAEKEGEKPITPETAAADNDSIKAASTNFVNDMVGAAMANTVKRDAEKEGEKPITPEPAADKDAIKAASTNFVNDMVGAAMANTVKRDAEKEGEKPITPEIAGQERATVNTEVKSNIPQQEQLSESVGQEMSAEKEKAASSEPPSFRQRFQEGVGKAMQSIKGIMESAGKAVKNGFSKLNPFEKSEPKADVEEKKPGLFSRLWDSMRGKNKETPVKEAVTAPKEMPINHRSEPHNSQPAYNEPPKKEGMGVATGVGIALLTVAALFVAGPIGALIVAGGLTYLDNKIRTENRKTAVHYDGDNARSMGSRQEGGPSQEVYKDRQIAYLQGKADGLEQAAKQFLGSGVEAQGKVKGDDIRPAVNTSGQQKAVDLDNVKG